MKNRKGILAVIIFWIIVSIIIVIGYINPDLLGAIGLIVCVSGVAFFASMTIYNLFG